MEAGVLPAGNEGQKGLCAQEPHRALLGISPHLLEIALDRWRSCPMEPLRAQKPVQEGQPGSHNLTLSAHHWGLVGPGNQAPLGFQGKWCGQLIACLASQGQTQAEARG